jgi:hypothetical protein
MKLIGPLARRQQQAIGRLHRRRENILVGDVRVRRITIATISNKDNILFPLPVQKELAKLDCLRQSTLVTMQAGGWRHEAAPSQAVFLVVDRGEAAIAGAGECDKVTGRLGDDCEVERGVFASEGLDDDGVGVDALGGGVVKVGASGVVLLRLFPAAGHDEERYLLGWLCERELSISRLKIRYSCCCLENPKDRR